MMTRREASRLIVSGAGALALSGASSVRAAADTSLMIQRTVPSSGEKLPVIGLGTWQTFDVGASPAEREPLSETLALFAKLGGRVIDSSPMYGRAEEVVGDLTAAFHPNLFFFATKVWTTGKEAGQESIERSFQRLRRERIDLLQVHNLVDLPTQLATLRDLKAKGRIRYVGVTHYEAGAFSEVERVLRNEKLDFLQINYSISEPEAERRLLALALEKAVAVLVNRPLGGGELFRKVQSKPLPPWAEEIQCRSWAQFFLKWVVAHPSVTCAIPATNKPEHLEENMTGGLKPLPDDGMRKRMQEYVLGL